MLTALQTKKLTNLFNLYDADGNGYLDERDYDRVAQNAAHAIGYQPGTAEYNTLYTAYMGIWQGVRQLADSDNTGQLTLDKFLTGYANLISQKEVFAAVILDMAKTTVEFQDRNKDGKIEEDEHTAYAMAHNISHAAALESFRRLDRNGDGYLTRAELEKNIEEFFVSDDPEAPGNWLLGSFEG
ncbi:MAG: hypothetical protein U0350_15645 [Caldilineaceae bacterium]